MNDFPPEEHKPHPLHKLSLPPHSLGLPERLADGAAMREMDRHAIEEIGMSGAVLMENAARAVVEALLREALLNKPRAHVVVCCGKGNNGGDGFAIARLLSNRGFSLTVVDAGEATTDDARLNQRLWQHFGNSVTFPSADATRIIGEADVLVDAIFGTGLERPVTGAYREWIETFNANSDAFKIAVDLPSGVSSDDSFILGVATRCNLTIALQAGKIGCFQFPGAGYAGRIEIADISIPEHWPDAEPGTGDEPDEVWGKDKGTWLLNDAFISSLMPERPFDAHKGTFGHLLTICGSVGMGGAAMLASMSALKNGAGLVTACVPSTLRDRLPGQPPEIMTLSPSVCPDHFREEHAGFVLDAAESRNAVVLGCGIGVHSQTAGFVRQLCAEIEKPLLIDADGLNNLDEETLAERSGPTVITPHPRELSRLCGLSVSEIQDARVSTVRRMAREWGVVLLLKGTHTVIGCPEGAVFINNTGSERLATAGSGDVLSGIIGGFMAQGLTPAASAWSGAFLHGRAADCLAAEDASRLLTASDLFRGLELARASLPDVSRT